MNEQRGGFLGSLVGVIGGGLTWLVVSGFVIGDPLIWAPPIALGAGLWWGAARAYARRPERLATVIGVVTLCVIVICLLYVDPVFAQLPDRVWGATTGKGGYALVQVKTLLGLLAALAAGFVAWDLQRER